MPRQKSAVMKGKVSRGVQRANKLKELKAELKSATKELEKQAKVVAKLEKAVAAQEEKVNQPVVTAVGNDVQQEVAPTQEAATDTAAEVAQAA